MDLWEWVLAGSPAAVEAVAELCRELPAVLGVVVEDPTLAALLAKEDRYGTAVAISLNAPASTAAIVKVWTQAPPASVDAARPAEPDETVRAALAQVARRVGTAGLEVGCDWRAQLLQEAAWADAWKRDVRAFAVGESLWVRPSWDPTEAPGGRCELVIDPGMAFGVGSHETTFLCLELLERLLQAKPAARVLDVGTGSGILAIACAKLGARAVIAVDLDPVAVRVASDNVSANGVAGAVAVRAGDLLDALAPDDTFDIVVGNLFLPIVERLFRALGNHLAQDGRVVVSGLVAAQEQAVHRAAGKAGLTVCNCAQAGDWLAIELEREGMRRAAIHGRRRSLVR
jgi:ribosomal protein L11 methyltransferase